MSVKGVEEKLHKMKYIIAQLQINYREAEVIRLVLAGIKSGEVDLDNVDKSIQTLQLKLKNCDPDNISDYSTGKKQF